MTGESDALNNPSAQAVSRTAEVDGYTVTLDGDLQPGREPELRFPISKAGQPVTDLQPYLEAYGHLVALRDRDLAYLHVHPAGSPDDGTTKPDLTRPDAQSPITQQRGSNTACLVCGSTGRRAASCQHVQLLAELSVFGPTARTELLPSSDGGQTAAENG